MHISLRKTCFRLILSLALVASWGILQGQETSKLNSHSEIYQEFDFWIGEWNVYKNGTDTIVGKSHIMSINSGMGLLENYSATSSAYEGKSLNTYNKSKGKWEQYWIDNSGLVLKLAGSFQDGKMVLEGIDGSEG